VAVLSPQFVLARALADTFARDVGAARRYAAAVTVGGSLPFLDHGTVAFAADPHGSLKAAREESPIVRTPTGVGVLTYAACHEVILDPAYRPGVFELIRRATPSAPAPSPSAGRTLLGSEGDDHQALRRVVMPWFTPRRIETLRVQTSALVGELLDGVAGNGACEFMADVAMRIPPTVFCWMVGCDAERGPELAHWSRIALRAFSGDPSVMDDVTAAIRELRRFADELIVEKQQSPGDDITSALLRAVADGSVDRRDVRSLLTELLSASVDNTTHAMGLAVWLLCEHPDQWAAGSIESAVEECSRYEPVIRHGNHVATRDVELLGVALPVGTLVTVYLASAHRDPAVYEDPDRFDTTRRPTQPQLVFGVGRHFCVGAALARMEIQEVVRAVTTRWQAPRVGPSARVHRAVAGEVDALPVEFETLVVS
jgi:cytochrome P450